MTTPLVAPAIAAAFFRGDRKTHSPHPVHSRSGTGRADAGPVSESHVTGNPAPHPHLAHRATRHSLSRSFKRRWPAGRRHPSSSPQWSKAGALGSFGFAYTEPAAMRDQCAAARALTTAPIHINLFIDDIPHAAPGTTTSSARRIAPDVCRGRRCCARDCRRALCTGSRRTGRRCARDPSGGVQHALQSTQQGADR